LGVLAIPTMNERPKPGERALTLDGVPDSLLAEYGFRRGAVTAVSYHCADKQAALVPTAEVVAKRPDRKLNEQTVRDILCAIRDGTALPPIIVFRPPGVRCARLVDGTHRWRVSVALGFPMIPCLLLNRDEADAYGLT